MLIERDKKTLQELDEASRLFREAGLEGDVAEVAEIREKIKTDGLSREFATLYEVGQVINSIQDMDRLLERIMDLAIATLEAERGLVILIDDKTGEHRVVTARNVEQETTSDVIRYSESVVRAASGGESLLSSDAGSEGRWRDFKSIALYDIKSFICVPLRVRDRVIGTVYIDSRRLGTTFDKDDLRFLEAFANQAALAIENARLMRRLREENKLLREAVSTQYGFDRMIGRSAPMERLFRMLARASEGVSPILLLGESGTGKELVAKSIHVASPRHDGPFIAVNCAAIPRELLESELFGHARGAFSGADREKKGLLEMADGGTFFFDEIAEMDASLQAKLLRVVEEGALRRVGETKLRTIDVRIVSATNRDLKEEITNGRFREDLFYRINVVTVRIPPLRERRDDIVPLAEAFLVRARERAGRVVEGFSKEALSALLAHAWPGNVRELENAVERAVALADGPRLGLEDLPDEIVEAPVSGASVVPEGVSSDARAAVLWGALIEEGRSFWEVVREPFLKRELSREDLKRLVERGLKETQGSYKKLAALFRVEDQYKKFHAFLKNSGAHIARDAYTGRGATPEE